MNMQIFFSEITALCRNEQFLHSVMEKYHYDPEEYPNLKRLAGEMIRQIESKALRKLRHPSRSKKLRDFLN